MLGCKGLIKHKCHKNEGNDLQLKKLLIVKLKLSLLAPYEIYREQYGEYASSAVSNALR